MSQQEKMKHGAKRSLFLLLEREGLGETDREKGEEIGRQAEIWEEGRGRPETLQALEKAAGLYGYVRQPLCVHVWSSHAGLMEPFPLPLVVTCPPATCPQTPPSPVLLLHRTPPAVSSAMSPPACFHQAKKLLSSQSSHAYSQNYPKLTDCWHIHIHHRGSSGLCHWTLI